MPKRLSIKSNLAAEFVVLRRIKLSTPSQQELGPSCCERNVSHNCSVVSDYTIRYKQGYCSSIYEGQGPHSEGAHGANFLLLTVQCSEPQATSPQNQLISYCPHLPRKICGFQYSMFHDVILLFQNCYFLVSSYQVFSYVTRNTSDQQQFQNHGSLV